MRCSGARGKMPRIARKWWKKKLSYLPTLRRPSAASCMKPGAPGRDHTQAADSPATTATPPSGRWQPDCLELHGSAGNHGWRFHMAPAGCVTLTESALKVFLCLQTAGNSIHLCHTVGVSGFPAFAGSGRNRYRPNHDGPNHLGENAYTKHVQDAG